MRDVFVVEFKCRNCNYKWKLAFPPEVLVRDIGRGVRVEKIFCPGGKDCPCGLVICPNCKIKSEVTVLDRNPI